MPDADLERNPGTGRARSDEIDERAFRDPFTRKAGFLNVLYFPIFRVPEYSEYLSRTGFALGFHWARTRNKNEEGESPLRIGGLAQRTFGNAA
jgi:hypothetical protein